MAWLETRASAQRLLGLAVFVALYVATGWLGLRLVAVSGFATPVWAPSGLALTALLGFGSRAWPAVALGAFVVNLGAGAPALVALGIAFGNTLEAVVGSNLLRRRAFVPRLQRIRDVVLFVGLSAIGSTVVSPTIGVSTLWLGGRAEFEALGATWITWWIGDALGVLVVASLLLVWLAGAPSRFGARGVGEASALLGTLAFANSIVFSDMVTADHTGVFRQAYVLFPILIWAAIRFGQHGTTLATFLTSLSAIVATTLGLGPFARGSLSSSLLMLQAFMGVVSVTMLILAAAVSERNAAIEARARALLAETQAREQAEAAEERARFLDESGRVLASSLEYRQTLQQMAELAVPVVADWCAVDIVEADGHVVHAALVHRDPAKLDLARELRRRFPPDPEGERGLAAVLRTGRSELLPLVSEDVLQQLARSQEHLELLRRLGLRSLMIVPLFARARPLGAIAWATAESNRQYTETDLALAQQLARRAAVAIDNSRLYEQAQNAIQAREQFLSIASHELRTPLAALTLQVQSLRRADSHEVGFEQKLPSKLQLIDRQVTRLSTLVDNLLDVSRVISGRLVIERETVDLRGLLREIVERFTEQISKSGSSLAVDADATCVGRWDRVRLDQIVTNLLSNAIKYGRGGPIAIRLRNEPDHALLSVKDSGIGIAPEDQGRIFERFERAVSHRNFGGLGLGLWITKQLVVALGGSIELRSAPGQGSEFSVRLPKQPASENDAGS